MKNELLELKTRAVLLQDPVIETRDDGSEYARLKLIKHNYQLIEGEWQELEPTFMTAFDNQKIRVEKAAKGMMVECVGKMSIKPNFSNGKFYINIEIRNAATTVLGYMSQEKKVADTIDSQEEVPEDQPVQYTPEPQSVDQKPKKKSFSASFKEKVLG
jgi:hypothetical protein